MARCRREAKNRRVVRNHTYGRRLTKFFQEVAHAPGVERVIPGESEGRVAQAGGRLMIRSITEADSGLRVMLRLSDAWCVCRLVTNDRTATRNWLEGYRG